MYEFAIVVLLGVATLKLIDMVAEHLEVSGVEAVLAVALGVGVAWALEFSLFAQWDIPVRSEWLGYIGTGMIIAAAGYATAHVFEHLTPVLGLRRQQPATRAA